LAKFGNVYLTEISETRYIAIYTGQLKILLCPKLRSSCIDSANKRAFAYSIWSLATDFTVRVSSPSGGEIFRTVQTVPGAHPASCTICTVGALSRGKTAGAWRHPPHLMSRIEKNYSYTSAAAIYIIAIYIYIIYIYVYIIIFIL
jgi:hypothetical protein